MNNVLFVGDEPSKKNTDKEIAFIGTKSCDRLMKWIHDDLKITMYGYSLVNSVSEKDWLTIGIAHGAKWSIVALGNNASKRLSKLRIKHFHLPHPSGRNRKLNDPKYIDSELQKCYLWLKETKCATSAMTSSQIK